MATLTEKHNVSWVLFPINNDRTAWRPISTPMILVETHRRTKSGAPIANSAVLQVRVAIEDVPREARVAGHDHVGLLVPDAELYARTLTTQELLDRQIDPTLQDFFKVDGTPVEYIDAVEGDLMQVTLSTGVRDTIGYLPTANYYDLSDIAIETRLLQSSYYNLTYQADYYARIVNEANTAEFLCINLNMIATAVHRFRFNHPGQVMDETYRRTPQIFFTTEEDKDSIVQFYRPITDILQDVFDEQHLLEQINWVDRLSPEHVPYLAFLLGLDIPFFPKSLDRLRRTMLRNVVRLQQLKGSRRALVELFELFGFTIYLINLFWTADGKRLIRPGESLPPELDDQEILIEEKEQLEPLLIDYGTDGYGDLKIPLLYRPTKLQTNQGIASVSEGSPVTLHFYLVEKDSQAHGELTAFTDSLEEHTDILTVSGTGVHGYSQLEIDGTAETATEIAEVGLPPFKAIGVRFDRQQNILFLTFNGNILFQPNMLEPNRPELTLFGFAQYKHQTLIIPNALRDLQSNKFDLQLLTRTGQQVTQDVLEFLIDFVFKLKAFHSILNVIIYSQELDDVYMVTDWCVGGDIQQRFNIDAGRQQVPPAIIPNPPNTDNCEFNPRNLGYKEVDLIYRGRLLDNLPDEHRATKDLDSRTYQNLNNTRLDIPIGDGSACRFPGQDVVAPEAPQELNGQEYVPGPNSNSPSVGSQSTLRVSPIDNVIDGEFYPTGADASGNANYGGYGPSERNNTKRPTTYCDIPPDTDYCYRGRVRDETLIQSALEDTDVFRVTPCTLMLGSGAYYTYPNPSVFARYNNPKIYSGRAKRPGQKQHLEAPQGEYLKQDYSVALQKEGNSWLGRLLRAYDDPNYSTIHFSNRGYLEPENLDQRQYLALERPSLGIQKTNMHLPGTRFLRMGQLEATYTDAVWRARPWDTQYSSFCGPYNQACTPQPSYLNAHLELNTDGDEVLVFDDLPYEALGNGQKPDLPDLNGGALPTGHFFGEGDVIHSVYSHTPDSHPAITLDQTTIILNDTLSAPIALFSSAQQCETTGYIDFVDGYPSSLGSFGIINPNVDRDGAYTLLWELMGMTLNDYIGKTAIATLGSGILTGQGYRLDCNCTVIDCGTDVTAPALTLDCRTNLFLDQNGELDWEWDHLLIEQQLVPEDEIGVQSFTLNGEIPTLFELNY